MADLQNNWVCLGKAYSIRIGRNWTEVSNFAGAAPLVTGTQPSWGNTTGSTENTPFMCCNRVDASPQWTPDLEVMGDFPEVPAGSKYLWPQYNPQWIYYLGW